jgi:hypothetical protein
MIHISHTGLEEAMEWEKQLLRQGGETGHNRQCAMGFHLECSDPPGESCECHCHPWHWDDNMIPQPGAAA